MYDIIIIGGGPAGLTSGIYARRANKSVLIIEKNTFGGQITSSPKVENIPGFSEVTGNEFAEQLVEQAIFQGVEFEYSEATEIIDGDIKKVVTDSGTFEAKAVIIATGTKHRHLGLDNEEKFIGDGISFCAVCDGAFFTGKTVAVIGGGNSALQEAIQLSDLAKQVYVVQNLSYLTGEASLAKQVEEKDNITVILNHTVSAILGSDTFQGITINNAQDNTESDLALDGMFVAIGLIPQNEYFKNVITLNSYGYADYDETLKTETKGIFVAGDGRKKQIRQVVTAASDGAVAALLACDYINQM